MHISISTSVNQVCLCRHKQQLTPLLTARNAVKFKKKGATLPLSQKLLLINLKQAFKPNQIRGNPELKINQDAATAPKEIRKQSQRRHEFASSKIQNRSKKGTDARTAKRHSSYHQKK